MCSSLFFSSFLFFSVSVKTQILVKYFFADSLHNFFSLLQQEIVSEIRTILIFHFFTDKSVAYVQIRPHYYTVFPAFPQHNLSRSPNIPPYSSNFLSSYSNIRESIVGTVVHDMVRQFSNFLVVLLLLIISTVAYQPGLALLYVHSFRLQ